MQIKDINIHHLRIPLRVKFAQSNSEAKQSDSIIVVLDTTAGVRGYGEACPRPYVTGEDPSSVRADLESVREDLKTRHFETLEDIRRYTVFELPRKIGLASTCALEIALLDAWSRETSNNLITSLGGHLKRSYTYSGVVPMGNIEKMRALLSRFNFHEIKIKVGTDSNEIAVRIDQLRDIYGATVPIRVDANCSWTPPQALELTPALIDLGVTCIEQPFPKGMESQMGKLTARYGNLVAVMADESLTSFDSARFLAENGLCNRFNLKISKHGGILSTLRIARLADSYGIPCQLGAHFGETSILTAAGITVASVVEKLAAIEGGMGTLLLERDVCKQPLTMDWNGQIDGRRMKGKNGLGLEMLELP